MSTRRTVLATTATAAASAALGAALPASAQAAPRPGGIPQTLARGRTVLGGRLRVPETEFPLSHLSVRWRGPAAQVRLRTRTGWGSWQTLHGCPATPDGRPAEPTGSALVVAPGAVGYEVWVAGEGAAQTLEMNTVDGPLRTAAVADVQPSMPLPFRHRVAAPYLSRAAWGADESLRFVDGVESWPTEYYPTQALTVHHTAGINDDPDPAATVRAIYRDQTIRQGWGDIGYNLLIDEAGRIYEGRWSGKDALPVFRATTDAGKPLMAGGAHAVGYNAGNIGVCLLGNFTSQLPKAAARATLVKVLAGLAQVCRIKPLSTVNYVNPVNGNTRTNAAISGHRDWGATECPGNLFYPELPQLRRDVAAVPPPPEWAPKYPFAPSPPAPIRKPVR